MGFAIYLLVSHLEEIGGTAGFIKAVPFIVLGWFLLGLALALYIRARNPQKYSIVGRMVNQGID
jgi:hypothetical protein